MVRVQFTIPRTVARELDVAAIRRRARDSYAAEAPSLEMNDKNAGPSSTRITCREPVARAIVDEIRVLAAAAEGREDRYMLLDCSVAVREALEAIDNERAKGTGPFPATGIGPVRS
jgi:hypothetical protein